YSKMLLEKEARAVCGDMPLTVLRPTFVYGPFNYAPRESFYFDLLKCGEPIPFPADATARFQMVYVKDVAQAVMKCLGKSAAYGEVFHLAAPEEVTYGAWEAFLRSVAPHMQTYGVTVREVLERGIPLPFPLDQNELVDGSKAQRVLGLSYTPFEQGMTETKKLFDSI
ncbi:MAG TPA: sugar dehydratase, partial [Clostridiales bacterium]|nr:sugar dehydratase [Clostridiales bacterium]